MQLRRMSGMPAWAEEMRVSIRSSELWHFSARQAAPAFSIDL
jgi:hypothetical protein